MTSRKIVKWEDYQPPREWYATLECGHRVPGPYDDSGMSDAQQAVAEAAGELSCVECTRLDEAIAKREAELATMKAARKP